MLGIDSSLSPRKLNVVKWRKDVADYAHKNMDEVAETSSYLVSSKTLFSWSLA